MGTSDSYLHNFVDIYYKNVFAKRSPANRSHPQRESLSFHCGSVRVLALSIRGNFHQIFRTLFGAPASLRPHRVGIPRLR